jgi:hypothetical protein
MAGDAADVEPGVAAGRGKAAVRGGSVDEYDRERVVDDRQGRTPAPPMPAMPAELVRITIAN